MKIALFSPFSSQNYGTVLQAFALSKAIKKLGADCEYITWRHCKPSVKHRIWFLLKHPSYYFLHIKNKKHNKADLQYSFLTSPDYISIVQKNKEFVDEYTPVNPVLYTYDELRLLENKYDKFIVGSDQTWTPDHLYQFSPYYLSFIKNIRKKFSYACSMGRTNLPVYFVKYLRYRLKSFDMLSCREKENTELLSNALCKKVYHVVDPTLLLDKTEWQNYMTPIPNMPQKFVLCYILGEKECIGDYAEFLGNKKGFPVYYILTRPAHAHRENVLKSVGVQEFLWLINNCQYLVTDSFHGTIFAINFGKEMISFDKFEGDMYDNGRIQNILSLFGIESHYMRVYEERIPSDIDYVKVNALLDAKKRDSLSYLNSIVNI